MNHDRANGWMRDAAAASSPEQFLRATRGILRSPILAHSMQPVVTHGSHHRGQITTLLRQPGAEPIATDLSRFHSEGGAATG